MGIKISDIWNQKNSDSYENKPPQQMLLKAKGDQLHVFMLIMVFIFSLLFTIANLIFDSPKEAIITLVPAPVIVLFYFFLFKKNKTILSKIFAVILIMIMLSVLSLINGPQTGILAFFIPVIAGALITLQGNEFKYALYLTLFSFCLLIFLLSTNYNFGLRLEMSESKLTAERIQNFIGAAFATVFEVGFLIIVSNKLQSNLLTTTNLLEEKNTELSKQLELNSQKRKLISEQLEQIRKADIELQKLSLIATQTKNGVIITDACGQIEWVNHAFEEITGWHLQEIIGKRPKDFLIRNDNSDQASILISEKLKNKEFVQAFITNYTKAGVLYYNQIEINPIFDATGKHTNFISIQRDITTEIKAKREIERLNERYELVVNKVTNDIIWELEFSNDSTKKAIDILSASGRKFNDKENKFIWSIEQVHNEDRDKLLKKIDDCLEKNNYNWEYEYRYLNSDGTVRILLDRGYIVYNHEPQPNRMIGAVADVTEKRKLEEALTEQKLQQQKLIAQIAIQSQEKEKNNVATELHENINQILAVAKMQLDFSVHDITNTDLSIKKSYENIEKALQEIRKLSHSLATPSLKEYNLIEAINDLINDAASESNVKLKFKNNLKKGIKIPDEINVNIYRLAQEQLNNVFQHAKASTVKIQISSDEKGIYLLIEDDGIGFSMDETKFGLGLKNIEGRVKLYSGKLTVKTEAGKGCKLEIFLPVNQDV